MLGGRSIGSRASLGSVETGGGRRGFYRDGRWSYHVRRAARNVGRDRIPFSLVTAAGVVDFVGIGTWYDISACCSHRSRHS